jgi:hypothetical protein
VGYEWVHEILYVCVCVYIYIDIHIHTGYTHIVVSLGLKVAVSCTGSRVLLRKQKVNWTGLFIKMVIN